MFYIIRNVTLKIDREWCLYSAVVEFYNIHLIKNLKPDNFEQTNKIVLLF